MEGGGFENRSRGYTPRSTLSGAVSKESEARSGVRKSKEVGKG